MSEESAVVRAISRGVMATLADGTVRVKLDFEPQDAALAFALMGMPGSPVAVARLATENTGTTYTRKPANQSQGKPLAQLAGMWCASMEFHDWLAEERAPIWHRVNQLNQGWSDDELAAECVRMICGVKSRADLDGNPDAAQKFLSQIRLPYLRHMEAMG